MDVETFRRGFEDAAPLLLGMAPFGLVVGVAAGTAGFDLKLTAGMSVLIFAGAAQLAALELLRTDAHILVVIVTAVIINLRMLMYSASIAPHFREFSAKWKAALAYVLTDPSYALSIAKFEHGENVDKRAYYLGVAVPLWAAWHIATIAGLILGARVPDAWALEFAVPLVFLALLMPTIQDRSTLVAAVIGGSVAVIAAGLPLNLGLPVGATIGIIAGAGSERVFS